MSIETVDSIYAAHLTQPRAITPHLPRLRALAERVGVAVEFGVKRGASSSALLMGARRVLSYDPVPTAAAHRLQEVAGPRWLYTIQSSLEAPVTPCGLLFLDSLHTYANVQAELARHADAVEKFLVAHDTVTFGSIGADGETGRHSWAYQPGVPVPLEHLGIRPAFDDLMVRDPTWRLLAHYPDSHGLLVLERRL